MPTLDGYARSYILPFFHGGAPLVLANLGAGVAEFNQARSRTKFPLDGYSEVRIMVRVMVVGVAGSILYAQYALTDTDLAGQWSVLGGAVIGTTGALVNNSPDTGPYGVSNNIMPQVSLATLGTIVSPWCAIAQGAHSSGGNAGGDVYLRLATLGGDSSASPQIGRVELQFRG
jgi:hypothetical protein